VCPSAQSGWIGRARRIFAIRCRLLHASTGGDVLAGLLPATQSKRRRRHQPIGQDRKGLIARSTNPASHPNAFVAVIMGLAEPLSMADDRVVSANRTSPREEFHGDHHRVDVAFRLWQCDKENHGWREGPPRPFPAKVSICWPGLHPPAKSVSNKKRILLSVGEREPSLRTLAGIKGLRSSLSGLPTLTNSLRRAAFIAATVSALGLSGPNGRAFSAATRTSHRCGRERRNCQPLR